MEKIVGFFGVLLLVGVAYIASTNRKNINWKLVASGIGLQWILALLIIGIPSTNLPGVLSPLFQFANDAVMKIISYSDAGAGFLFGPLMDSEKMGGMIIAVKVLPTIIFFSALMAIFYHLGIMQKVVYGLALLMQKTLKISGAESLAAAANVFVGQTEAPLIVRPYIKKMTDSEIMSLMTGGMATVAGGVLAAYVGMLTGLIPNIAGHLITASVMSAPAALIMAKILVPETKTPETLGTVELNDEKVAENLIGAAASGTAEGTKLAINVGGMLIGFIAVVALFNGIAGAVGEWFAFSEYFGEPLSLELVLGWIFSPIAFIMGIAWENCVFVGQLIGKKIVLNEFVAYLDLANEGGRLSERAAIISSYALCGFANFSSIAIQIGGIGGLEESKTKVLAKYGLLSLLGGTLAACMTGAIVGVLI